MEQTLRVLNFASIRSDKISKHYPDEGNKNVVNFCLSMIDRLNFSACSLKILLKKIEQNSKVEYSCGIIIRSVLLDYMILLNAIEILLCEDESIDNGKELEDFCCKWLADSVGFTINNISLLYANKGAAVRNSMYLNIVKRNPEFFKPYSKKGLPELRTKNLTKSTDLYKKIRDGQLKSEASVYEAYQYYSKYDHFGQMFKELNKENIIDRINRLEKSIYFFPRILNYSIAILLYKNMSDSFLVKQNKECSAFLKNLSHP